MIRRWRRLSWARQRNKLTQKYSTRALRFPLAATLGLAGFLFLPQIRGNDVLFATFAGVTAILLAWLGALFLTTRRTLKIEISLRPQHYLQALAHTSIFVYWGIYWQPLQDAAALIAAQIVFAYAFDMLLAWSRRETYTLGFGPFPVIYSTNLFLRFHDDWFYLQFLMVAVGFLAKELIVWHKDGRRTHIFNPSSFPLALFSLGLIVTGTTRITWGEEIATLLILPPQIYLFIFLVALPGQFMFRVTTMTLPAVLTTYLFSWIYLKATGTYFFFDSNVPIAVFLGMHLLFTDPSTAPRTEVGRIIFGVMYGLSVVGLYALLGWFGVPTFYDKLLQVPLMNLSIKAIDRLGQVRAFTWRRSLAYVTIWILLFGTLTAANGLGDHHPGHTIPFWDKACRDGRRNACRNLQVIESRSCRAGSPWACNELAVAAGTAGASHRDPQLPDYVILLEEGKGRLPDLSPFELYTRACAQGYAAGCGDLARFYLQGGDGVAQDKPKAAQLLENACASGHAMSCSNSGLMYKLGDGVPQDDARALSYLAKACDLGMANACRLLDEQRRLPRR